MAWYRCGGTPSSVLSLPTPSEASGAIAQFNTDLTENLLHAVAEFSASQDLHGQSSPYPAGGGKNKFSIDFLTASGITISNGEASGSAFTFADKFGATKFIPNLSLEANTQYTISFDAYTDGASTSGTGLYIAFKYDDESTSDARCPNNTLSYTRFSVSNDTSKNLVGIYISYSSKSSNIWYLKNIQLEEGSPATAYAPYENICPITPVSSVNVMRTGKNLIAGTLESAGINSSGVIGSSSSNNVIYARCKAGVKYSVTSSESNKVYAFYTSEPIKTSTSYNGSRSTTSSGVVTITAEIDGWLAVRVPNTDTTPQIEFGESVTTYEAPTVVDKTINLGDTYYGGSVDAVTGKITKKWKKDDLTQLTWSRVSSGVESPYFTATLSSGYKYLANQSNFLCSHYEKKSIGSTGSSEGIYLTNSNTVRIRDNNYTTASDFKNSLTNVELVYELATPIVVYASNTAEIPTIVGDNQVFADSGNIAVKFFETVGHKI